MKKTHSTAMYYAVRSGDRKTTSIELARELAAKTGRAAIEFLSDKVKDIYLKAYPDLATKIKSHKGHRKTG